MVPVEPGSPVPGSLVTEVEVPEASEAGVPGLRVPWGMPYTGSPVVTRMPWWLAWGSWNLIPGGVEFPEGFPEAILEPKGRNALKRSFERLPVAILGPEARNASKRPSERFPGPILGLESRNGFKTAF